MLDEDEYQEDGGFLVAHHLVDAFFLVVAVADLVAVAEGFLDGFDYGFGGGAWGEADFDGTDFAFILHQLAHGLDGDDDHVCVHVAVDGEDAGGAQVFGMYGGCRIGY